MYTQYLLLFLYIQLVIYICCISRIPNQLLFLILFLLLKQVHELSPEKLKQREVQIIDIGNDSISSSDYKEDEDPKKFKSQKSGRGPLHGNWIETV